MKKNIVILGGGTGLPAMLRGIKYIDGINITAIVTIADSGGSTGILSKKFNIPAVGDLRRVISSLSTNREQLEKTMEYRFKGTNSDLDGHTMGNLFLTTHILMNDSFAEGIEAASNALNISGVVLPVSNSFNHLQATLQDGTHIEGEDKIGHSSQPIKEVYYNKGKASKESIDAILKADLIIFGIGSLYTSLIPNLIYPNMVRALKNTKAEIVYFSNIFTQPGETDNMTVKDHVKAIEKHTFKRIIDKVIFSSTKIPSDVIKSYEKDGQYLVKNDYDKSILVNLTEVIVTDDSRVRHSENKIEKFTKQLL